MYVKRDITIVARVCMDRSHYYVRGYTIYDQKKGLFLNKKNKWTYTYDGSYLFKTKEQAKTFLSAYFKTHSEEFADYIAKQILK